MAANTWKLQDAKAQFSEVVRRARSGAPQEVTVHGKKAVVIVDPTRFDLNPKKEKVEELTMAEFIERSKKYRGLVDFELDRSMYMDFPDREFSTARPTRRRRKRQ